METILRQILAVQSEILAELRGLRQDMAQSRPLAGAVSPDAPNPAEAAAGAARPSLTFEPVGDAAPEAGVPQAPPVTPAPPRPAATEPAPRLPAPPRPESPPRPGGMLTMHELADLGGQFLEPGQIPKTRVKAVDVADLGGSLLDEIKAKNRAKRDAFAEFDRLRRDR